MVDENRLPCFTYTYFILQGPFVQVDNFVALLMSDSANAVNNVSQTRGGDGPSNEAGVKRKREAGGEIEGEVVGNAPINDIYRSRQQKRVHLA